MDNIRSATAQALEFVRAVADLKSSVRWFFISNQCMGIHQHKLCIKASGAPRTNSSHFCSQDKEKMDRLRGAVNAQAKYTLLVRSTMHALAMVFNKNIH